MGVGPRRGVGRDLGKGTTRVLAKEVSPAVGLATAPGTVVFAARGSAGTDLIAADLRGDHHRVLTRSLLAPFDARGDMVAWAEGDNASSSGTCEPGGNPSRSMHPDAGTRGATGSIE